MIALLFALASLNSTNTCTIKLVRIRNGRSPHRSSWSIPAVPFSATTLCRPMASSFLRSRKGSAEGSPVIRPFRRLSLAG